MGVSFGDVITIALLLVAAYTFLWPRSAQRPPVPAQRRHAPAQQRARPTRRIAHMSVLPTTSYGALAYVVVAYCAVAVAVMRDIARSCAGAWRDVLGPAQSSKPVASAQKPVAQLAPPVAQPKAAAHTPTLVDDDFADSRAKVAQWSYVAPPPMAVQKQPSSGPELPPEPPELAATAELSGTEPLETVGGKRKAAILAALDKGLTASQIADIMPIQRQRALRMVALVQEERVLLQESF